MAPHFSLILQPMLHSGGMQGQTCGWSEFGEGEGHELAEALDDVDLVPSGQEELDGVSVFLELEEGLPADAAGCSGFLDKVAAGEGGDGNGLDGFSRPLGSGGIERGTLATDSCKGGILLVGADENLAVIEHEGGSHLEITVGRIGVRRGLSGHVHQFFLLLGEFIIRINPYLCGDFLFSHVKNDDIEL